MNGWSGRGKVWLWRVEVLESVERSVGEERISPHQSVDPKHVCHHWKVNAKHCGVGMVWEVWGGELV